MLTRRVVAFRASQIGHNRNLKNFPNRGHSLTVGNLLMIMGSISVDKKRLTQIEFAI